MSDVQGLPGKGPNSAQYVNATDTLTIFGSGTENTPLTTSGGDNRFGTKSSRIALADISLVTAAAYPIGTPVYESAFNPVTGAATYTQAIASAPATSGVMGLMSGPSTGPGAACPDLVDGGLFEMTTAQWDAVVVGEAGGLTPGAFYYLNTAAGLPITTTPPAPVLTNTFAGIGIAISPTIMRLRIGLPWQISSP
jgi:hypothetical protein